MITKTCERCGKKSDGPQVWAPPNNTVFWSTFNLSWGRDTKTGVDVDDLCPECAQLVKDFIHGNTGTA